MLCVQLPLVYIYIQMHKLCIILNIIIMYTHAIVHTLSHSYKCKWKSEVAEQNNFRACWEKSFPTVGKNLFKIEG